MLSHSLFTGPRNRLTRARHHARIRGSVVCSISQLRKQFRNVTHHHEGSVMAIGQSSTAGNTECVCLSLPQCIRVTIDAVEGKRDVLTEREANRAWRSRAGLSMGLGTADAWGPSCRHGKLSPQHRESPGSAWGCVCNWDSTSRQTLNPQALTPSKPGPRPFFNTKR